ncbi:TlpA family protein disulfide reductase [Planctomycetaceae bacterium SH139]
MSVTMLALVLAFGGIIADGVKSNFVPKGVTQKLGGYRPIPAELSETGENVQQPPADLETPKFGQLKLDGKLFGFILVEPTEEDAEATLYVDANADGDYTNDPEVEWNPRKIGAYTQYSGTTTVELGEGRVGSVNMYRFDPTDARRASAKNLLLYYADFGYEYSFVLDGQEVSTFAAGGVSDGETLTIDRNQDGKISRNFEALTVGKPFNFTGTTYLLSSSEDGLKLAPADVELPQTPLPPDLRVGKQTLAFTATTMDGKTVNFPKDYAGKIVMLDFWATWCGPCIGEIPHMKAAYTEWHDKGFDILGVSFDGEGEEDKVKTFLEERELPWAQIYEGKGWNTDLGTQHDVSGIPFVLLIDGDTGEILANATQLRGEGLPEFIGEVLAKRSEE